MFFLLLLLTDCQKSDAVQNEISISNDLISVDLQLPDPETGYYRGSRFDWSGVISQLSFKGHSYFGKWFEKYDPFLHDAITGPVDAFDPLGYDSSKVGEFFTKIGVGLVERIDTAAYRFSKPYKVVNFGKWKIATTNDQVEFIHDLTEGDFPYSYSKIVRLNENKMIIEHTLTNRGSKVIETQVFNHNFFVIDSHPTGPGFEVAFPYDIIGDGEGLGDFAEVKGNQIVYKKELIGTDRARLRSITGYTDSADDYKITIENVNTGAGVHISGDRPLSRLIFWSAPKTLCPEPYIKLLVPPNMSTNWSITYEFYTL